MNGSFWVFYGGLTNLAYTLTITDTVTGAVKVYTNPAGRFASAGDTTAFPASGGARPRPLAAAPDARSRADGWTDGQGGVRRRAGEPLPRAARAFQVHLSWKDFSGKTGAGQAVPLIGRHRLLLVHLAGQRRGDRQGARRPGHERPLLGLLRRA